MNEVSYILEIACSRLPPVVRPLRMLRFDFPFGLIVFCVTGVRFTFNIVMLTDSNVLVFFPQYVSLFLVLM